jgi:hypothetical protein
MEEKNQRDRLLEVSRGLEDTPEGRVKFEGASQGYEFLSEESEGEENNREVEDDPPDSSSPEGRVKSEGARRGYQGFQSGPVPGTFTRLRSCMVPAEITEPPQN